MNERKVFALRGHEIAGRMTLREQAGRVDALDSTGARVALATYIHGTGWVVAQEIPYRKLHGVHADKESATQELRRIAGGLS